MKWFERIERFKPEPIEIISIMITIIIYTIAIREGTMERMGAKIYNLFLLVGLAFGILATKKQWGSIKAARDSKKR